MKMMKAVKLGAILFAVALTQAPARANVYLFTVTASDLLLGESGNSDGLANAYGQTLTQFEESAYFDIFLQPVSPQLTSPYSFVSETSPNPTGPNAWEATTIDDPSSPVLGYGPGSQSYGSGTACTTAATCTWAQFYAQNDADPPYQSDVMVYSDANNGGLGNIFVNHTYDDAGGAPYGWGSSAGSITITEAVSDNCVTGTSGGCTGTPPSLSFEISTLSTLTGPIELLGYADDYRSSSTSSLPSGFGGPKEYDGIAFTLEVTPTYLGAPEPGTWAFLATGLLLLGVARWGRKKRLGTHPDTDGKLIP